MRSDMGRVVIERPRRGSSNPSLKARRVGRMMTDLDEGLEYDGPLRIPSSGNGMRIYSEKIGDKDFSDVLGPINGYLRKSVGRKWDEVYSELSANLGAFSWPLQHIMRFHIDVETNTYLGVDDKVYAENKYGVTCVSGPATSYRRHGEFYVHPITRVLAMAPVAPRRFWTKSLRPAPQRVTDRIQMAGDRWMVKVNGNWFIGTYGRHQFLPAVAAPGRWGQQWEAQDMSWPNFVIRHGTDAGSYVFTRIKSANRREINQARAMNDKKGRTT